MARVNLTANVPKRILTGARSGDTAFNLKTAAGSPVIDVDIETPGLGVGEGYEVAAGQALSSGLAAGEDVWAICASNVEVQLFVTGGQA